MSGAASHSRLADPAPAIARPVAVSPRIEQPNEQKAWLPLAFAHVLSLRTLAHGIRLMPGVSGPERTDANACAVSKGLFSVGTQCGDSDSFSLRASRRICSFTVTMFRLRRIVCSWRLGGRFLSGSKQGCTKVPSDHARPQSRSGSPPPTEPFSSTAERATSYDLNPRTGSFEMWPPVRLRLPTETRFGMRTSGTN